jgi:hypothetical protein
MVRQGHLETPALLSDKKVDGQKNIDLDADKLGGIKNQVIICNMRR